MSGYSQELIEKSMPDLSKHVLTEIQSGGPISAYQLHRPDYGRMDSCLILGTPEGIVIMGDFCPNHNHGCTSDYKYTLDWFAGKLGIGYLLEKFGLEEKFQPELAAEGVKFWLDEMLTDEDLHPEWRKWAEKEASRSFKEFCDIVLDENQSPLIFVEDGIVFGDAVVVCFDGEDKPEKMSKEGVCFCGGRYPQPLKGVNTIEELMDVYFAFFGKPYTPRAEVSE